MSDRPGQSPLLRAMVSGELDADRVVMQPGIALGAYLHLDAEDLMVVLLES